MKYAAALRPSGLIAAWACLLVAATGHVLAQRPHLPETDPARHWTDADSVDGRWNEMQIGPFIASVIKVGEANVAKGLSIRIGDLDNHDKSAQRTVCYDTQTCAFRGAWSGGFVKFHPRRYGIVRAPEVDGRIEVATPKSEWERFLGFAEKQFGGIYQHGQRVVLSYQVESASILESPWVAEHDGIAAVSRTFLISPHNTEHLALELFAPIDGDEQGHEKSTFWFRHGRKIRACGLYAPNVETAELQHFGIVDKDGETNGAMKLHLNPSKEAVRITLLYFEGSIDELAGFQKLVANLNEHPADIDVLRRTGAPLWPKAFTVDCQLGKGDGPYVVDTIGLPFDNSYKGLLFGSGVDFFSDGRAAFSTLHGDVWTVSDIEPGERLKQVTWRRYATGLHHPLGLKIVDDKVYVLGKDQITRLHDRNGDGEADHYECFNNGGDTSLGGHDYASCLETDPEGAFYYIRAKQGVCRVSKDGREHKVVARGFRNPVGLGVGPTGMVTAAPQEGNWTPASCLFAVKQGGYYGFAGPEATDARPLGYDPPLTWMPRSLDNSSGGQVWVTSDKWGPLQGQMLHLSYGMCSLIGVMHEEVDGVMQGGAVKFDLPQFTSGVMRGRFGPDGQLYVVGMMGWQTAAAKDGCLHRVRYTSKPVAMPVKLNVKPDGVSITFSGELDPKTAGNPDNYFIETWNYLYSKEYGSKEYRPSDPKKFGRDEVFLDDARLSDDGRTVHLQLEEINPVMQMAITYQIESAEGKPLKQTIYNTIHVVPKE